MSKADENTEAICQRRIQSVCADGFGSELRGSENYEIPHLLVWTPGRMNVENRGASFQKRFSAEV